MKSAFLSLVAAAALSVSAGTADARPPAAHHVGVSHSYSNGGNYNRGYYGGYRGNYRPYYGSYYGGWGGYYPGYGLGSGSVYPSYGYSPYYRNWGYRRW